MLINFYLFKKGSGFFRMPVPVAHAPSSTSAWSILDCSACKKAISPCKIAEFYSAYLLSKLAELVDEGA